MVNYTIIHLHSDLSNGITNIDSITKFEEYIVKAKENNMKAIAFTEHGNCFNWYKKYITCKENNIKFIFGIEVYITKSLTEKVRDNYHTCLYAKNNDGIKEINKLISQANNRKDGHFYYVPRITIDEFLNLSNNIIISSACLGSVLASDDEELKEQYLQYFIKNKDRCFLEIQHHKDSSQIKHNQYLYDLHNQYNIPLITGTDTHILDEKHVKARDILQKAKGIHFDNEDGWDLVFKSYNELVNAYERQNSLSIDTILEAINNTNILADMVEEYQFDLSFKYPKLYENSEEVFKEKITEGVIKRQIDKKDNYDEYKDRINEEFEVMKKIGAIDYMLLQKKIIDEGQKNGVQAGFGRGSVTGSLIAYLLGITEVDSIKFKTNFFRFMSPFRISLCDVDVDYGKQDREWIREYIFNMEGVYTAEIITFNTVADLGAIRDVGRALDISLEEVNNICKNLETQESNLRERYQELFSYVDIIKGVIVSIGTHPSGILVSPIPLDEYIGLTSLSTTSHYVSQLNMKEVDSLNYVKLDVLGLDNINVINETCKFVGIDRLTPDTIDYNDDKIYDSIKEDTTTIFQMESNVATSYIKKIFSDESLNRIKEKYRKIDKFSILDFCNGAIRPSGESFRDKASQGICGETGLKELDDMMFDTLGYCLTQEQIMMFLNQFCGYSMSESDSVRRAIGKKQDTTQFIDDIKKRFLEYSIPKFNLSKEDAEQIIDDFIQVIISANRYGFSRNHSFAYTSISVACAWLRYYYPLEYLTSCLNTWIDDEEKTNRITQYAITHGITIKSPQFGYSKGLYFFNRETNSIFKGVGSIKFLNSQIGDNLFELSKHEYKNFLELLHEIKTKTSCNSKQLDLLVRIGYFKSFNSIKNLIHTIDIYDKFYGKKSLSKDKLAELGLTLEQAKKYGRETEKKILDLNSELLLQDLMNNISDEEYPLSQLLKYESEILGFINYKDESFREDIMAVQEIDTNKWGTSFLTLYRIQDGSTAVPIKVDKQYYNFNSLSVGDMIQIDYIAEKPKKRKIDGKWVDLEETEMILTAYHKLKEL